ncbi:MAG: CHAD domain-containing protein [Alphaproteobacteria bacterium]
MRHLTVHAAIARANEALEAVHQVRVSASGASGRRSRSTAAPSGSSAWRSCSRTRQAASPARDLDVFDNEILSPAKRDASNPAAAEALSAELAERRRAAWTLSHEALTGADYRLLLLDLAEVALCGFVPGEDAAHPAAVSARSVAGASLDHRFAKAKDLADRFAELTSAERHEFRKHLKKLRYVSELFASLYEKGIKHHFAMLASLQDDLGHLNDVAVARRLLGEIAAKLAEREPARAQDFAYASGEITGWHAHRAAKCLKRAVKHWRKLAESAPFWQR